MYHHVVYVLTSSGCDIYSAMTRLSVASLLLSNHNIKVTLVCDSETDAAIDRAADRVRGEFADWMVIDTPVGPPVYRNRYIKTNLRKIIEGPFLFLDSDTLIRKPLRDVFEKKTDLAVAANHSSCNADDQVGERNMQVLQRMGWKTTSNAYFNGGVIFYNDTDKCRTFSADWHEKWKECIAKGCGYLDQPALNAAIADTHLSVTVLDDTYNKQVMKSCLFDIPDASIWHYYYSGYGISFFVFEKLLSALKQNAEIQTETLSKLIKSAHPFVVEFWQSSEGWRFVVDAVELLKESATIPGAFQYDIKRLRRMDREVLLIIEKCLYNKARLYSDNRLLFKIITQMLIDQPRVVISRIPDSLLKRLFRTGTVKSDNN